MEKQYYNKSKFGNIRIINIVMYGTICFGNTPFFLGISFYLVKNCDISGEINVKMCIIEKSKNFHSAKTLS